MSYYIPKGHVVRVTADYGSAKPKLALNKNRLGRFTHALLRNNGQIVGSYVMSHRHQGSYMCLTVVLPEDKIADVEAEGGVGLEEMAVLVPASGGEEEAFFK